MHGCEYPCVQSRTTNKLMKSALILKNKKTNKIFHVIVEEADKLQQYINLDDTKTEYTIIPDWELVKEAIKYLIQK